MRKLKLKKETIANMEMVVGKGVKLIPYPSDQNTLCVDCTLNGVTACKPCTAEGCPIQ